MLAPAPGLEAPARLQLAEPSEEGWERPGTQCAASNGPFELPLPVKSLLLSASG